MTITSLETAKEHLRVEHNDEDALITAYIQSAESMVAELCDLPEKEALPAPVQSAVLLMVGDLYEHREAQIIGQQMYVNRTVDFLLSPYRKVVI